MLFRVLSGEYLKLKRTLALWMVLVSPLVMVLLQFAVSYKGAGVFLRDGKDAWPPMVRQTVEVWTLLMMPMFVTLETSLLAGLENTGKNWKSLLALPSPRWTVYVSKLVVTITLLWAAHAVLIGGTIGSGLLLKLLHPALNLGRMPLSPFVLPMLRVSVSALLAVAIQHWVSLRWHSYTAAMGFGIPEKGIIEMPQEFGFRFLRRLLLLKSFVGDAPQFREAGRPMHLITIRGQVPARAIPALGIV